MVSVDTRFGICVATFNFSYIHSDMLKCLTQDHSWLGDSVVVGECKEPMGMPSDSLDTSSTKIPRKKAVLQNCLTALLIIDGHSLQVNQKAFIVAQEQKSWSTS